MQRFSDLGKGLPLWARYIWDSFVAWLKEYITKLKIEIEMRSADRQAAEISQQWGKEEDAARLTQAEKVAEGMREELRESSPGATVSVVQVQMNGGESDNAVLIEKQPDGSQAQSILGGEMQIINPYVEREE